MILGGIVALCIFNKRRKEEMASTVELGINILEAILDIFFG